MQPPFKKRSLTRQPTLDNTEVDELCSTVSQERLSGTSFLDGTLLPRLAKEHFAHFAKLNPLSKQKPICGKRTWGTLCSGSEGAHFCMRACQDAMNARRATFGEDDSGTTSGQDDRHTTFGQGDVEFLSIVRLRIGYKKTGLDRAHY